MAFSRKKSKATAKGIRMKRAMVRLLVWVAVLGLGQVSWADLVSLEKLVNPQHIRTALEQGQGKVKVIVNLAKRRELRTATDWNSRISSSTLRADILTRQQKVLSTLAANDFSLRHRFENQPGFSAEITLEGLNKLLNDPSVESIEPVYTLEEHLAQGIPLMNAQGYRSTYNGQGVAIAICDTGVDYYHPMLGNGPFPNAKVIGGYDFGDNDSDPSPNGPHGTACAGIAAGDIGAVGDYVGGVAYGAMIYALKTIDSSGVHTTDSVVRAWDWCVTHKNDNPSYPILVISTSLGHGRFISTCDGAESALATAANNAVAAGITLLVSSGNNGYCNSIASPACLTNTISVGAVYDAALGSWLICVDDGSCADGRDAPTCDPDEFLTRDFTAADSVAVYSNTASFLDILAPAHNAYTTDLPGIGGYSAGDYVPDFGGTSAACPYAAGAVACLQSAAKDLTGSYLTPSEVRSILVSTGDNITDGKVAITKPRINLGRAIDRIIPPPPAPRVTEYQSSDAPKEIEDRATTTSTLLISDAYPIKDVDVRLNITHSYVETLIAFLFAPDGTRVELFSYVGNDGHSFSDTVLDDEAETSIARGSAPFEGAYRPEGTLADFDGKNVNGIWTLQIRDYYEKYDVDTLNSWSLIIEPHIICPVPPMPANPNPPDADENVPINTCLSWNDLDGAAHLDAHSSMKRTRRVRAGTGGEIPHIPAGFTARDGILVEGQAQQQNPAAAGVQMSGSAPPRPGAILLDFDGVSAPCIFSGAVRLTDRYAALGVTFEGPGGNDGGAILGECSGFSVSGQSSPNFLAFNSAATLSDGGIPRSPEILYFDPPVSSVQILAASGDAEQLTIAAYADNVMVDSARIDLSSVMSPIGVQGPGITRVVIGYSGMVFVLDDLTFLPQQDCRTTWAVYLGTQPDALGLIASDLAQPNYCPGGLEADIWYYWQVIANNPSNQMPGSVWSFRTTAPPVAKCQDVTVAADSNCLGLVTVEDVNCCTYDPDGDPISLSLDPAGPYIIGDHYVMLIVTDDKGASDSNSARVTVLPTAYCYKKGAIAILEGILEQDPNAVELIEAIAYLYLSLGDNHAASAVADMNDSQVAWAGPDRIAEWQGGFADVNVFEYEQQACARLGAYIHNGRAGFAADVSDALLLLAEAEKKLADTAIFDAVFHRADPNVIAAAKTLRSQGDAAKAEGGMKICNVALAKYAQAWQMAIDSLGPAADHNRDAKVDIDDFVIWGEKWLESYPPDVD